MWDILQNAKNEKILLIHCGAKEDYFYVFSRLYPFSETAQRYDLLNYWPKTSIPRIRKEHLNIGIFLYYGSSALLGNLVKTV